MTILFFIKKGFNMIEKLSSLDCAKTVRRNQAIAGSINTEAGHGH